MSFNFLIFGLCEWTPHFPKLSFATCAQLAHLERLRLCPYLQILGLAAIIWAHKLPRWKDGIMSQSPDICDQLRAAVRESEWSLHAISQAAGIDYSSLYKWMKCERRLRLDSFTRLAKVFQMELTAPVEPDWNQYE